MKGFLHGPSASFIGSKSLLVHWVLCLSWSALEGRGANALCGLSLSPVRHIDAKPWRLTSNPWCNKQSTQGSSDCTAEWENNSNEMEGKNDEVATATAKTVSTVWTTTKNTKYKIQDIRTENVRSLCSAHFPFRPQRTKMQMAWIVTKQMFMFAFCLYSLNAWFFLKSNFVSGLLCGAGGTARAAAYALKRHGSNLRAKLHSKF